MGRFMQGVMQQQGNMGRQKLAGAMMGAMSPQQQGGVNFARKMNGPGGLPPAGPAPMVAPGDGADWGLRAQISPNGGPQGDGGMGARPGTGGAPPGGGMGFGPPPPGPTDGPPMGASATGPGGPPQSFAQDLATGLAQFGGPHGPPQGGPPIGGGPTGGFSTGTGARPPGMGMALPQRPPETYTQPQQPGPAPPAGGGQQDILQELSRRMSMGSGGRR